MRRSDSMVLQAVAGARANVHGWVRGNCPFCEGKIGKVDRKKCLGLHLESQKWHCFAGETRVVTRHGYFEIRDLVGREVELLTTNEGGGGAWVVAPVSSFGVQPLLSVHLSRNGVKRVIRATPEHRWFVGRTGAWREVTTKGLAPGHRLRPAATTNPGSPLVSPWGVAHGVAFGDGECVSGLGVRVNLWGEKDAALRAWFPLSPQAPTRRGSLSGTRVDGLPRFFKSFPSLDESPAYLYGWLAGYFAADGCVDDTGLCKIASASLDNIEFVRKLCLRVGIFCFEPTMQMRKGYGTEPTPLYSLVISRSSLSEDFFLTDEHRRRWVAGRTVAERRGWVVERVEDLGDVEEVFCATVPGTASFALEGHILTGNCFRCGSGGYLVGLSTDARDLMGASPEAKKVAKAMEPPEGFWLLFEGDGFQAQSLDAPRRYLTDPKSKKGRGLSEDVLRAARVGACVKGPYTGRVVVPVFGDAVDEFGDPVWLGWSSRPWVDDYQGLGYRYPEGMPLSQLLYNHAILRTETDEPALVVEGVFDVHALWPNGCATLGGTREPHLEAFRAASRPVVLVPDGDAWFAGMLAAKRLRFDGVRAGMLRLPPRKDPDEFPPDVIREAAMLAVSSDRDYIAL